MQPILEIKNISKKFRIQHEKHPYQSMRDSMANFIKHPFSKNLDAEEFWALKDVSIDIHPGESIGIIGKNGAGKSTLLKILSKITPPSSGKITSRGRIASLLEVGTGFHAELSGRENIFLNGSILGMKRKEILAKFDEIVDFSGVEKFLDMPIKHYSSGMQLRLAFAVAAFLEPEILLIDEVLAVGDFEFQQKCMGKMNDISKNDGRTIIFVSHSISAIASLCSKTVMLEKGQVVKFENTNSVIAHYVKQTSEKYLNSKLSENNILKNAQIELEMIDTSDLCGYNIHLIFELNKFDKEIGIDIIIKHENIRFCYSGSPYFNEFEIHPGVKKVKCTLGPLNFAVGIYSLDIIIIEPNIRYLEEHLSLINFEIEKMISNKRFNIQQSAQIGVGFIIPTQKWSIDD